MVMNTKGNRFRHELSLEGLTEIQLEFGDYIQHHDRSKESNRLFITFTDNTACSGSVLESEYFTDNDYHPVYDLYHSRQCPTGKLVIPPVVYINSLDQEIFHPEVFNFPGDICKKGRFALCEVKNFRILNELSEIRAGIDEK